MNPWDDNANYEIKWTREEIITSLLAENSFAVEVNTTKENNKIRKNNLILWMMGNLLQ